MVGRGTSPAAVMLALYYTRCLKLLADRVVGDSGGQYKTEIENNDFAFEASIVSYKH